MSKIDEIRGELVVAAQAAAKFLGLEAEVQVHCNPAVSDLTQEESMTVKWPMEQPRGPRILHLSNPALDSLALKRRYAFEMALVFQPDFSFIQEARYMWRHWPNSSFEEAFTAALLQDITSNLRNAFCSLEENEHDEASRHLWSAADGLQRALLHKCRLDLEISRLAAEMTKLEQAVRKPELDDLWQT